ncbi:hypothetical protein [Luteolibacter soli]|uniref:DUF3592 domain-containing protein n=1 Tax=Luteolibacter soli TaxID=3135280 RepID=A0ABU9AY90_9BACT
MRWWVRACWWGGGVVGVSRVAVERDEASNRFGEGGGVVMRRPMYRWKSFWLGILVLGFLGWANWQSHVTGVVMGWDGSPTLAFARASGDTYVIAKGGFPWRGRWGQNTLDNATIGELVRNWRDIYWVGSVTDITVASGALAGWAAFLAWRLRRERSLTEVEREVGA